MQDGLVTELPSGANFSMYIDNRRDYTPFAVGGAMAGAEKTPDGNDFGARRKHGFPACRKGLREYKYPPPPESNPETAAGASGPGRTCRDLRRLSRQPGFPGDLPLPTL